MKHSSTIMDKKPNFKSILVTGGAGYIGTSLIPLLLQKGFNVRALDSLMFGPAGIIPFFAEKRFEFIKGDVRDKAILEKTLKGIDAVIHLAAIVGFPACRKDPALSRDINVNGTKNLVKATKGKIPIFFASTGSNYGKMLEKMCTETTPLNPLSDYGRQKTEAEAIVQTNKKFVIYRFATAFGVSPRMRLDLLPNDFTYRAVNEKTLIVYEKNFMRTFIHVRDMAQSFLFALRNYHNMEGETYNVGSEDMNYSKEAIALIIKKKVDYYLHFSDVGHDLDKRDYMVSYEKLRNTGFHTTIDMGEGIDELVKLCNVIEIKNPYYNA